MRQNSLTGRKALIGPLRMELQAKNGDPLFLHAVDLTNISKGNSLKSFWNCLHLIPVHTVAKEGGNKALK